MNVTREQLNENLKEVDCGYETLCELFGKEEIDKRLNNAVKTVIDYFYATKEIKKS